MIKIKNKYNISMLIYTLCFCITALLVYYGFWKSNKTFIWQTDGFEQHFPAMYEVRENLRTILKSGFKEIPFWNWNVGLGLNLAFIYTYDMFYCFAAFLPKELLVGAYSFFIIFKLYLSGLFLILYLKELNINGYSSIIGGLVYSFCGYALYAGIRHPFFISPMVIFPLIILGIERYLVKDKSKLLVASVLIATISHYYFLYMMGIGAIIYTVIRCNSLGKKKWKEYLRKVFDVGIRSMLGMGLGAAAILPNIYLFIQSDRQGSKNAIKLMYDKSYYASFITSFISPKTTANWTILMFSGITIIIVPLIFTKLFKGFEYIKNVFIVMTLMLFIPYIGSVMNGFSDVSNRWIFMYAFFVACSVAIGVSRIKLLEKKHFIIVGLAIAIYINSALIAEGLKEQYIISALFSIILLIIILLIKIIEDYKQNNVIKLIMIFAIILNITYISNYYYMPSGVNYIKQFTDNNKVLERYSDNTSKFKGILSQKEFFRTDQTYYALGNQYGGNRTVSNDGLVSNINSSGEYVSMMNNNIYEFYKQNNLFNIKMIDSIIGYDNRSALESLLSVKYKMIKKDDQVYLGKGYELIDEKGDYKLYENKDVLPIGIFYSNYISAEDYANLPPIDKSMVLLQGVVLENGEAGEDLEKIEPKSYSNKIEYQVGTNDDIAIVDNKIVVKKENSELNLIVNIPSDSEIYLDIKGLDKKDSSSKNIYISRDGKEKSILLPKNDDIYDPREKNKLICLGYTSQELKNEQIKFRFVNKGTYTFDELNIRTVSMKDYDKYVEDLKKEKLSNVEYSNNYVKGNINVSTNGVMFFSIPYDKGWTAEVDGHKIQTLKLNTGFLGIPLKSGNHSISLRFYPPGLNLGLCITFISVLITCAWYYSKRYSKKIYK